MYPQIKELRALRCYFAPPPHEAKKNEICFKPNYSYQFISTMAQVFMSDISLTFTVAIVTKMVAKIG